MTPQHSVHAVYCSDDGFAVATQCALHHAVPTNISADADADPGTCATKGRGQGEREAGWCFSSCDKGYLPPGVRAVVYLHNPTVILQEMLSSSCRWLTTSFIRSPNWARSMYYGDDVRSAVNDLAMA